MEIEVTARKWGNSIGFTIPNEIVEKYQIKEKEKIKMEVKKKNPVFKKAFGMLKDWKIDAQKVKDELREEWDR